MHCLISITYKNIEHSIFLVELYSSFLSTCLGCLDIDNSVVFHTLGTLHQCERLICKHSQFCLVLHCWELWVCKTADYLRTVPNVWLEDLEKGVFTFVLSKYRTDEHSAKAFYVNQPHVSVHIIKVSEINFIVSS